MGEPEITAFLSKLAARGVAASTQNQALSGILFLYEVVLGRRMEWMTQLVRAQQVYRIIKFERLMVRRLVAAPEDLCRSSWRDRC